MRIPAALLVGALAIGPMGCAKFPGGSTGSAGKRLVFTMTVNHQINANYFYVVALRPSNLLNPTDTGPVPVIAPPWGNGIVAGNCAYFVKWDHLTSPNYGVFKFFDTGLTQYYQTGIPVAYTDVADGGNTIRFELDLSQIADTVADAQAYQSVQINFLTMDGIPQGTSQVTKTWDALGDENSPQEINDYITIPLTPGVYTNASYGNLEPTGDCSNPDLDIVDWSVEVRNS